MDASYMTRIGAAMLKISILSLLLVSLISEAAVRSRSRKKPEKLDPFGECQLQLLTPDLDPNLDLNQTTEQEEIKKMSDLTLMQGEMFDAIIDKKHDKAAQLRKRIESQLYSLRLPKTPGAYVHDHQMYDISVGKDAAPGTNGRRLSWVIYRDQPAGGLEMAGYTVVQAFGNPIQMSVTIPHGVGSLQVFHGYPNPPLKSIDEESGKEIIPTLSLEPISTELRREIQHNISMDSDMFLIDFLTLNKGRYAENVVYDSKRRNPLIAYDFDAAFMAGNGANFEFFDKAQSWYGIHALDIDSDDVEGRTEYYKDAKAILKHHIANSNFDWKKAIDNMTPDREELLVGKLKHYLRDYQAALQIRGQICALRAALYNGDLRACRHLGFNLSKLDSMRAPGYRQHDR